MDAVKKSYDIPKFKEQYENFIGGNYFDKMLQEIAYKTLQNGYSKMCIVGASN
ncbi:MAG: hypothetical protein LH614_10095 [Pyrinomonadaceae bacterium]|nr:hypothetical protein [Pyrinomonadaceae bacterium]